MKTTVTTYLKWAMIFSFAFAFLSCSKEREASVQEKNISAMLKFVNVNNKIKELNQRGQIIIVRWSEWGRKKKNCKGFGLCDAEWFPAPECMVINPIPDNGGEAMIEKNPATGNYHFDILLSQFPPGNLTDQELILGVDENIQLNTESALGQTLAIPAGEYAYDKTIGDFGGYRINLN